MISELVYISKAAIFLLMPRNPYCVFNLKISCLISASYSAISLNYENTHPFFKAFTRNTSLEILNSALADLVQ